MTCMRATCFHAVKQLLCSGQLAVGSDSPICSLLQVVKFGGGNKGQPAREILDNPCAEHFILFQIG